MIKGIMGISILLISNASFADTWEQVEDEQVLKDLFSDKIFEATLKGNVKATATYNQDGTGILNAWNDSFTRTWSVENGTICVKAASDSYCDRVERSKENPNKLRATRVDTGEAVEFTFEDNKAKVSEENASGKGGASTPSNEELALKLSNPTAPVMTLGNNIDIVTFDGDLSGSSDESAVRYSFQSVFPFKLDGGRAVFFRPTIPLFFNEPQTQTDVGGQFTGFDDSGFKMGDIGFDLSFGQTFPSGLILGGGLVGTIPTGSDGFTKDLWAAGPELLVGKLGKWGITLGLLTHQWDYAGSGDGEINTTSFTYIYAFQLGGGWQLAAAPVITYDHTADSDSALSLPLGVGIAKTTVIAGRPWKFQVQYWNYIEQNETFGVEHQIRFSINPVISAPWNEGS